MHCCLQIFSRNFSIAFPAVLLLLEGLKPADSHHGGGNVAVWEGSISVEHILPQVDLGGAEDAVE